MRLVTTGELAVADLTVADYARCIELIEGYHDLGADGFHVNVAGGEPGI